jgi:hypothetical protein
MAWLRVFVPIFIFVHGFLTAPLLVECINQDGRCLIEILGQDPCHEARREHPNAAGGDAGSCFLTGLSHQVDTCTDLMLESAAGIKACADYSAPSPQAAPDLINPQQALNRSELPQDDRLSKAGEAPPPEASVSTRGVLRI